MPKPTPKQPSLFDAEGPSACAVCGKPVAVLCDAIIGRNPSGHDTGGMGQDGRPFFITCDAPVCEHHAKPVGSLHLCTRGPGGGCHHDTVDLCPVHAPWGDTTATGRGLKDLPPLGPGDTNAARDAILAELAAMGPRAETIRGPWPGVRKMEIEFDGATVVVEFSAPVDLRVDDELLIELVDRGPHIANIINQRTGETVPLITEGRGAQRS